MKYLLSLVVLSAFLFESPGQDLSVTTAKLDTYLISANNAYRFNGVAAVVSKGRLLFDKGYGFSRMTSQTLNTPDTRFPILSITKSFTSTVILKLQEENKLSVNDKLTKYLPDYPNGSKISIHHVLTHSSGIYDYAWDVDIEDSTITNYPLAKDTVLNHFKDKPTEFRPGKNYQYSNSGYFLLGLIIEKVTGKPYETVVREMIFEPLEMTQSGFDFIGVPQSIKAQGYQFWDQEKVVPYKHYDSTFAYAAGSIYSTSSDMQKWAKAIRTKQILSPKSWDLAFSRKIQNYGYGWQIGEFLGKSYVKHSGGYPGYMSEFIYFPAEDLIIILLNNFGTYGQNIWSVGMGISCIVFDKPYDNWTLRKEVPVDTSAMQIHTGHYSNGKSNVEVKFRDDKLYANINGRLELQMHAASNDEYFFRDFNTTIRFQNNEMIVHEHGEDSRWIRKK